MKTLLRALALSLLSVGLFVPVSAHASTSVPHDGGIGAGGRYDYSPTVLEEGNLRTYWWCAASPSDTIHQEQVDISTGAVVIADHPTLGPSAGSWDSRFTCNPDVVRGIFVNPLGNGATYTYELFYVGFGDPNAANQIGVAFSNDGATWHKYPTAIITSAVTGYYGAGQPSVSYVNGVETLVYDWIEAPGAPAHPVWTSLDGVTWTQQGSATALGLPSPTPSLGELAYDPLSGFWYGTFNAPFRPSRTTGGVAERGQPGFTLYRTADLYAGTWQELDTIDTSLTGEEANFIAGLLRNPDGSLAVGGSGQVTIFEAGSWPRPLYGDSGAALGNSGGFNQWQIQQDIWTPNSPERLLVRADHPGGLQDVTTGWYDSAFYTSADDTLGYLFEAPTGDATVPLYACKLGSTTYFVSTDSDCMGQYKLGLEGYAYGAPGGGRLPLYRCEIPGTGDFVSHDPGCEGQVTKSLLGYSSSA